MIFSCLNLKIEKRPELLSLSSYDCETKTFWRLFDMKVEKSALFIENFYLKG